MSARDDLHALAAQDMPVTGQEVDEAIDAYRAEVLREAVDAVLSRVGAWEGTSDRAVALNRERSAIAAKLRRMADEVTP